MEKMDKLFSWVWSSWWHTLIWFGVWVAFGYFVVGKLVGGLK